MAEFSTTINWAMTTSVKTSHLEGVFIRPPFINSLYTSTFEIVKHLVLAYNEAMTTKQLQDQLSLLIIRASMRGKYAISQVAEDNHLTMAPALALCLLEPGQALPMKALSTFMCCDPSNITVITELLVSEGLVERKESAQDRRIKTVELTKKGLAMRDKFLATTTNARLPHLDHLTEAETRQLIAILEKATDTSATQGIAAAEVA